MPCFFLVSNFGIKKQENSELGKNFLHDVRVSHDSKPRSPDEGQGHVIIFNKNNEHSLIVLKI